MRLVLASASPRRRELIGKLDGVEAEIIVSNAEENAVFTTPAEYVCALAKLKAEEVYTRCKKLTLGADTIVYHNGVLGKPHSKREAEDMLWSLSGGKHEVYTGVCIVDKGKAYCDFEVSEVEFLPFTKEMVENYVGSGSPMDKAGAYGVQDSMVAPFVKEIRGCRDNVIGLPVNLVRKMLKEITNG